jgi:hypothetical protein
MDWVIGNPAGWWALLGIPAVLGIHFLQHQARRIETSTLFLLAHVGPESREGRVVERLRTSPQLWLQLLAVLLLTWLLVQPRWVRADSFQRVVVVLDSSVSMAAFREGLAGRLRDTLAPLGRAAALTEWRLLESDPGRGTLYAGTSLDELCDALGGWSPRLGAHALEPALAVARSLAGDGGAVVLMTDHEPEFVPAGVEPVGVGRPLDQCGFAGVRVEGEAGNETWTASIRNYGDRPAERTWELVVDGRAASRGTVRLAPDETRTVRGDFPPGYDRLELVMAADALALDDRLPVVRPRPKRLAVAMRTDAALAPLAERLLRTLPALDPVRPSENPDFELYSYEPGVLPDLATHRICVPRASAAADAEAEGLVVGEPHPLTEGLSWGGLLCRPVDPGPLADTDEVLVWQGNRPLVILRRGADREQLVVAFDLHGSNAERIPAFVLLLHRFIERIRAAKPALAVANVEVNQLLSLPADPAGGDLVLAPLAAGEGEVHLLPARQRDLLRAPVRPGFFAVTQDGRALFEGAARFADAREADLRGASSFGRLDTRVNEVRVRNSRADPAAPIWGALLIAAVLGSWAARGSAA